MGSNGNGGTNGDEIRIDVCQTHESDMSSEFVMQFVGEQSNVLATVGLSEILDMGSTPKADYQRAMSLQQPPVQGFFN